jgi:heme/copper-type cytochrome/quinol oxidase subunit 2
VARGTLLARRIHERRVRGRRLREVTAVNPVSRPPNAVVLFLLPAWGGSLPAQTADASVEVTASRFEFQPEQIEVAEGDRVRLTVHSADSKHGFAIPRARWFIGFNLSRKFF